MTAGTSVGDDLFGRPARLDDMGDVEIALLRIGMDMRLGDRRTGRPCAGSRRPPLRRADLAAPCISSRTSCERAVTPRMSSVSRRGVQYSRAALIGQPGLDQTVGEHLPQVARRLALHAGGDFLGAKFEQQVGHQRGSAACLSTVRASSRHRPARAAVRGFPRNAARAAVRHGSRGFATWRARHQACLQCQPCDRRRRPLHTIRPRARLPPSAGTPRRRLWPGCARAGCSSAAR